MPQVKNYTPDFVLKTIFSGYFPTRNYGTCLFSIGLQLLWLKAIIDNQSNYAHHHYMVELFQNTKKKIYLKICCSTVTIALVYLQIPITSSN